MWTLAPALLLLAACGGGADAEKERPGPTPTEIDDGCEAGEAPTYLRYVDDDEDHWGVDGTEFQACDYRLGASFPGDCDDGDASVHPGASEFCAGPDVDCDGVIGQAGAVDAVRWWEDADGDGYGDRDLGESCTQPEGAADTPFDCDDTDPTLNPGAAEICDGIDQDCDYRIDEDAPGPNTFCYDVDGDGYGDPAAVTTGCAAPDRYVTDCTDCGPHDGAVHPGATEASCTVDGDGNCDGVVDAILDADHDGYFACEECDDTNPAVRPGGADECGDGIDGDCDGADENCVPEGPGVFGEQDGADELFLTDMVTIADADGDGQDDLVVGAPEATVGGVSGGGVFVYLGPLTRDRQALSADLSWMDAGTCVACGTRVLFDDFDGDGVISLVVSDVEVRGEEGSVHFLADSRTDTLGAPTLVVEGEGRWGRFGEDGLARGPDIDGDGAADLLIGDTSSGSGGVVFGVSSAATGELPAGDAPMQLTAAASADEFGASVVVLDADGDGLDDVVVGAPKDGDGKLYRFLSPVDGHASAADVDSVSADFTGFGLLAIDAGDLDEDGYRDVLSGVYDTSRTGVVTLLPGGTAWPVDAADIPWTVTGDANGECFGRAFAALAPDHVVFGTVGTAATDPGALHLFTGPWVGTYNVGDAVARLDGFEWGMGYGAASGDLDGDGLGDFTGVETLRSAQGVAWLWSGASW